ncbi:MAG: fibronectin type III domain-containing protein, partial [Ruminococcus sp.]|nr:fibronectin type III domain-containing protein [Ruminococcus sp.]
IMPNSLNTIGDKAFDGCVAIKSLSIPGSVTKIGESAFENCTGLTWVAIPDSVTYIGGYAFGFTHATGEAAHKKTGSFTVYGTSVTAKNFAAFFSFKLVDPRISTCKATLDKKSYVYNSKGVTPVVTVKSAEGAKLVKGTDYVVTYADNKKCGKATAAVKGIGKYKGTVKLTYIIKPGKTKISNAKSTKAKKVKVTWKKTAGGVSGYQVQISTDKKFKKAVTAYNVKKGKTVSKTISKLKSKKTYYVRVRAYKLADNKKNAGKWSAVKKVKCK